MNKARRKEIDSVIEGLTELMERLEGIRDEEEEYFDNMPESLQYSEKGETAEEAISNLESAMDSIEEAISSAEEAKG